MNIENDKTRKLKQHIAVLAPLGAGLLIMLLLTTLGGLWHYQNELDHQTLSKTLTDSTKAAIQQAASKSAVVSSAQGSGNAASSANTSGTAITTVTNSGKPAAAKANTNSGSYTASSGTAMTAAPSIISLNLSIDSQVKGMVMVTAGSSQCNVLSQALAEGVISSLDMRYSSQYGTEGVYVIDGLGDPGTVWWTYKVNGTPPPYGCSYTTAHNGDSVNWQYVKS